MDMGDERRGLRLPGVRTDHADGSFDVDYDIPLAFFDCRLDDGVTEHKDVHDSQFPAAGNPRTHPEWWGKTFYKHMPHKGFVGDIFTVNGTAYPTLEVKRRKYRFRFLDASISRIYDFHLMSSTQGPKAAKDLGYTGDELDGQWRIPDGQQCMKFTQVASDGGLLPFAITRDNFELWPAKRREFIIDFTQYQDGTPTTKGDVVYLTNVMKMDDGRMWTSSGPSGLERPGLQDPGAEVRDRRHRTRRQPDPGAAAAAASAAAAAGQLAEPDGQPADLPGGAGSRAQPGRRARVADQRPRLRPDDHGEQLEEPRRQHASRPAEEGQLQPLGDPERRRRLGAPVPPAHGGTPHRDARRRRRHPREPRRPDDLGREDVAALDPGESVILYRGFRDFTGPYVAHCHNLAHEDHAMMFGWEITP